MTAPSIGNAEAQLQLERILASTVFKKAQRSQRFLRYLVEFAVKQPRVSVKEYAIALEVFDRSADYDPTIDATVRVEASRLRQRLREYYEAEGKSDPVLISVPKGSYQAVIRRRSALEENGLAAGYSLAISLEEQSVRPVIAPLIPETVEHQDRDLGTQDPATTSSKRKWTVAARWFLILCVLIIGAGVSTFWYRSPSRRSFSDASSGSAIHSLAVLPLQNLSKVPNTEYFAAGMTQGLSAELLGIPNLKVVSDSSLAQVNDGSESLARAARQLDVDAIVHGSVLRLEDGVKIEVHLFDARSKRELWGATFQDRLANITAVQKSIAALTAAHALVPAPSERLSASRAKQLDVSAYDGYLQGRYLLSKRDAEGAVKMFQRAVVLDPGYARSWAGLAAGYAELGMYRSSTEGLIPQAKVAARHAIELDPGNGEAWSVLGQIAFNFDRDWKSAEYDLERATTLSPNDSTTESRYAIFLSMMGRCDEAVRHMRRALELDPLSFFNVRLMGSVLYWSRRYDESLEYLQKAEEMEPDLAAVIVDWEVDDYQMKGMLDQAILTDLRNFAQPDRKRWRDRLNAAYRRGGRKAYWAMRMKNAQSTPEPPPCNAADPARIAVFAGDTDQALANLQQMFEEGCFWISIIRVEPVFDPIRGDPRFQEMLRGIHLGE